MKSPEEAESLQEVRSRLATFFQDVAHLERQARDLYDAYLLDLAGEEAAEIVTHIRDQEIGHMRIADELQTIMKTYQPLHEATE